MYIIFTFKAGFKISDLTSNFLIGMANSLNNTYTQKHEKQIFIVDFDDFASNR
jgi:hypothetical protein